MRQIPGGSHSTCSARPIGKVPESVWLEGCKTVGGTSHTLQLKRILPPPPRHVGPLPSPPLPPQALPSCRSESWSIFCHPLRLPSPGTRLPLPRPAPPHPGHQRPPAGNTVRVRGTRRATQHASPTGWRARKHTGWQGESSLCVVRQPPALSVIPPTNCWALHCAPPPPPHPPEKSAADSQNTF